MYYIEVDGETVEYADSGDFALWIAESWREAIPGSDVRVFSEVEK